MTLLFIWGVMFACSWVGYAVGVDSGERAAVKRLAASVDQKQLEASSRVGRLGEP